MSTGRMLEEEIDRGTRLQERIELLEHKVKQLESALRDEGYYIDYGPAGLYWGKVERPQ